MESVSNFFNDLPKTTEIDTRIIAGFVLLLTLTLLLGILILIPKIASATTQRLFSEQASTVYQKTFAPFQNWLFFTFLLSIADLAIKYFAEADWITLFEVPLALIVVVLVSWLGASIFSRYFDLYLLDAAIQSKRKINSELLLLGKILVNIGIILVVIVVFAQTHDVNLFGLIASLGVGGLAVAFAAQKSLEQLLGGIILYVDRPFVADDYIGLPDGTFGRVESIGLRSTKIRIVAKGTLIIVPNSVMANLDVVENITRSKKVMALLYLDFVRSLKGEEEALVQQVVKESTDALFGIDPGSTRITLFQPDNKPGTRARVTFFILGSNENSFQLRKRLLELANDTITEKLIGYGIEFTCTEPTVYVDSPVTI